MDLLTYLNPDAIENASIEGIKLKDGSISASKIDGTVASKSYVDDTITSAINTKANVDDVYTNSEVDGIASRNKGLITELATAGNGYNVKLDWSPDIAKENIIDPAYRGQVNLGAGCTTSSAWAYAEGSGNTASGNVSHAEGSKNTASGGASHVEGAVNTASADTSHAEGQQNNASGIASHAEGILNTASGNISHAEGRSNIVLGLNSHAECYNNIVSGNNSHVEGSSNITSGHASHAEGFRTVASGAASHTQGDYTVASGDGSSSIIGYLVIELELTGDANATSYICNNISGITADNPEYLSYLIGPDNYGYIAGVANIDTIRRPIKIKSVDTSTGIIEMESTLSTDTALDNTKCIVASTAAYGNYSFAARGISVGGSAWTVNRGGFAKGDCSFVGGKCNSAYNNSEVAFGHFNKSTQSSDASRAPIATIGIGDDKEHRKNAIEIMQNGDAYMFGVGGYDGSNSESAARLQDIIPACENITYSALVDKRNAGQLIPGMQYRITDYDFTTTEEDTDSAHLSFDIIVIADSESTLNENARAAHHQYEAREETLTGAIKLYKTDITDIEGYANEVDMEDYFLLSGMVDIDGTTYYRYDKYEISGDTYENTGRYILLESIDLDSLGVSLGNPLTPVGEGTYGEDGVYTSHSEDSIVAYENGTVTVGSTVPLNDRDIAFWELKYTLDNIKHSSADGAGTILYMKDEFRNECNYDFINARFKVYEITACPKSPDLVGTYAIKAGSPGITYGTNSKFVPTFGSNNHDNVIKSDGLAKIVFSYSCYSNTFGPICYNNTFGPGCYSNTFDSDCNCNTFGPGCNYNTFGPSCDHNTFDSGCYSNTFDSGCNYNTFDSGCNYNTFDSGCSDNTFSQGCSDNTFGPGCYNNTFGDYCHNNTFDSGCNYNTFGPGCYSNTFGSYCHNNTFGDYCGSNSFGNRCSYIKFASDSSASTKYSYYQNNHFGNGCQYILFKGEGTASNDNVVQNYNFAQGLQGTSSEYLVVDGIRNLSYETKVAKNKNGELKVYCEAELIQ